MTSIRWALQGLAIGPQGQQMDVEIGFSSEPTEHNIDQGRVNLEVSIWQAFPKMFDGADPVRVEVHLKQAEVIDL